MAYQLSEYKGPRRRGPSTPPTPTAPQPVKRNPFTSIVSEDRVQVGTELGKKVYQPAKQVAASLARMQAVPETREQGLRLQRQFQSGISDADLGTYGLSRIDDPEPGLLQKGLGAASGVLGVLDRPSQAVLRGLGGISGGTDENAVKGFFSGLAGRGDSINARQAFNIDPTAGGRWAGLVDTLATIALDPTTYLTFGVSSLGKRALTEVAEEIGEEAAEQIARYGFKAATSAAGGKEGFKLTNKQLRKLNTRPTFQRMDDLSLIDAHIRGGAKLQVPFRKDAAKTLLAGENLRSPLRDRTLDLSKSRLAKLPGVGRLADKIPSGSLIDEIRPAARFGEGRTSIRPAHRGTRLPEGAAGPPIPLPQNVSALREGLRKSGPVQGYRDKLQVMGNLRGALGSGVRQRLQDLGGAAHSTASAAEEVRERANAILKRSDIDDDTKSRITAAMERSGPSGDDMEGLFEEFRGTSAAHTALRKQLREVEGEYNLLSNRSKVQFKDKFPDRVETRASREARKTRAAREAQPALESLRSRRTELRAEVESLGPPKEATNEQAARAVEAISDMQVRTREIRTARGPDKVDGVRQLPQVPGPGGRMGTTPSLFDDMARVPRILTPDAKGIVGDDTAILRTIDETGKGLSLAKKEERIKRLFPQLSDVDVFEKDPTRFASISNVDAQLDLANTEYINGLVQVDIGDGRKIAYLGGTVPDEALSGKIDLGGSIQNAPSNYKPIVFMGQEMKVHPELLPEIKRMKEGLFNPKNKSALVKNYDSWLNMWKGFATVPIIFGGAFHMRNMQGNIYLNWLEGVRPKAYLDSIDLQKKISKAAEDSKMASLFDKPLDAQGKIIRFADRKRLTFGDALVKNGVKGDDLKYILEARQHGVLTAGLFNADIRGGDIARAIRSGDKQSAKKWIVEQMSNPRESFVISQGSAIGKHVEDNARLAHFISKRADGLSAIEASQSAKRTLFDYSELTPTEQSVMKRIVPFYTFMRKNTPVQIENMMKEPRRFLTSRRLQEGVLGSQSEEEDKALPRWARDAGMIPLPSALAKKLTFSKQGSAMFGIELPSDAALQTLEPFMQMFAALPMFDKFLPDELDQDRSEIIKSLVGLPGGGYTEIIKAGIEEASGVDMFTGAPVDKNSRRETFFRWAGAISPLATKLDSVGGGIFDRKMADDPETVTTGLAIMTMLTGIKMVEVGPRRQKGEMSGRVAELAEAIEDAKNKGILVPTVAEMRKAGLLPKA